MRPQKGLGTIVRVVLQRCLALRWKAAVLYARCELANLMGSKRNTLNFYCNACDRPVPWLVHISNSQWITWHSACPYCDSRKRHRGLIYLYERLLADFENPHVLHFAPEPVFYPFFSADRCRYETTDFFLEDVTYPGEDIQKLSFADGSFDLILCNHVIEHVEDDHAAFCEINRILKDGGKAIITIPGKWTRESTVHYPDLANNGHYRDYGMDVVKKMESIFANVEVIDLWEEPKDDAERLGLEPQHDLAFICY